LESNQVIKFYPKNACQNVAFFPRKLAANLEDWNRRRRNFENVCSSIFEIHGA
jgi:hypothetical protein